MPPECRATLYVVAMSAAVAEAAGPIPHRALLIAPDPATEAMLHACGKALDTASPP